MHFPERMSCKINGPAHYLSLAAMLTSLGANLPPTNAERKPCFIFLAKFLLVLVFTAFYSGKNLAAAEPILSTTPINEIHGVWLTEDNEGAIELYPCENNHVCGRIFTLSEDEVDDTDSHNPEPTKRKRHLCGLTIMGDFTPTQEDRTRLESGWVYSPIDGNKYSAHIKIIDKNSLEMRGYFLTPVLGQSQIWTRAPKDIKKCRSHNGQ